MERENAMAEPSASAETLPTVAAGRAVADTPGPVGREPKNTPHPMWPGSELADQLRRLPREQWLLVLRADQHRRWQQGDRMPAEAYLEACTGLTAEPSELKEVALDLIFSEVLLREERGESPQSEEYVGRFPQYAVAVQRQFELHAALHPSHVDPETATVTPSASADARPGAEVALSAGLERQTGADTALSRGQARPALPPSPYPAFAGYEVLRELGRGGMGIVYQARDCRRAQVVALKTLQGLDATAVYRFKQEFRALANVTHPSLVALYELISDGRQWFFTMEFVEGVDFLVHVRAHASPGTQCNLARLREALRELAEGVSALHQAGKLHRDIKPRNVLVTPQGRVVLLDFGLAAELDRSGLHQSTDRHIMGTVAYMSPEQAAALPVSPATDWYSVGVVLYEALTGDLPFRGSMAQIFRDKDQLEPPPPRTRAAGVPDDLDALCTDLLRRDPAARPAGPDVLRRLGARPDEQQPAPARPAGGVGLRLIGRERQRQALTEAFATVKEGRTVTAFISGNSGTGKSALVQSFLDELAEHREVVVLAGQCYEQESVPYKAFDSVLDSLTRYLVRLSDLEVQTLLPRDLAHLARVFPVLRRVPAVGASERPLTTSDPHELRRRAFAALRELLARLGDRKTLVVVIDDLQWGDVDSAALLSDLLQPPDPPVFLLIGCYRAEEALTSSFLQAFGKARPRADTAVDRLDIALAPLERREAEELVLHLLGRDDASARATAEAIGRESGGNPFFIHELAHASGPVLDDRSRPGKEVSLDKVLWERIQRLPAEAQRLLAVLATAGQPLGQAEACRAASSSADLLPALTALRSQRLVRSTGLAEADVLATYHDRVRETVVRHLPANALKDLHQRLAETLEATGRADPEFLAVHYEAADEGARAGEWYSRAADRAAETLAFDRAARLYELALRFRAADTAERRGLQRRLGDALVNARRGSEAARAYLAAAAGAPAAETIELQRRAAEQMLWSGFIDQGLALIDTVLRSMGMKLPRTARRALWSLLFQRFLLRLRGFKFQERPESVIPPEELLRIDTCWSIALGLIHVDTIRGAEFETRHLRLALRTGEPYRIVRALCLEIGHAAFAGGRGWRRTEQLIHLLRPLAERSPKPHARGMAALAAGYAAFMMGRWKEARVWSDRSEQIFREQCVCGAWELNMARFYALRSLELLGELRELARRLPAVVKDADDRGDLHALANLRTRLTHVVCLMDDDADGAARDLQLAMEGWSRLGFHMQHYYETTGRLELAHYAGDDRGAWELICRRWPDLNSSLLTRMQSISLTVLEMRVRSAIAQAAHADLPASERGELLRLAERDLQKLERENMPWSNPYAPLYRAASAAIRRKPEEAVALLEAAVAGFEAADMALHAVVARRCRGQMLGGDQGRALVLQADAWMTDQGIRNPARWARMYAPGFPGETR